MTTEVAQLIPRLGTSAVWAAANPVLALGEHGFDTTVKKEKIGDGVTAWNDLAFQETGSSAWGDITGTLSAQTDLQNALDAKEPTITKSTGILSWTGAAWAWLTSIAASFITQDSTHRFATDTEKSTWNGKQDALGFTAVPNTRTVAGKALSADVTLAKADVGLGNVDNTSDANKPVSNDTQTALNAKQATLVSGTNIKTINSQSLLGSGDITITGTSGKTIVWFTVENTTAVTTGEKQAMVPCPVSGTIVGWSMTANPSTSAAISIWKAAGVRPTVAGKITASAPPTLTAAASASSTTLTGWTTTVTAGDLFVINVDSNSAATWLYVALEIQ